MKATCKHCGIDEPDHRDECPVGVRQRLELRTLERDRAEARVKELEARPLGFGQVTAGEAYDRIQRLQRIEHAAHVVVDLWEESKWLGPKVPEPLSRALASLAEEMKQ